MLNKIKNFHKDIGGNFAIMFGLALTPLMLATGLAVDYSRMTSLNTKMAAASDAALLAAMKKLDQVRTKDTTYEQTIKILEDEFEPFFEANLLANNISNYKDYDIDFVQISNEAVGTVTIEYEPIIMKAFGKKNFDLTSELRVNLKMIPENFVFDIVMCIDATGSMQDTIDEAVGSAGTFDAKLRTKLGVPENSNDVKIRIRPIYYRDYTEQSRWQAAYDATESSANTSGSTGSTGSGSSPSEADDIIAEYHSSSLYRYSSYSGWTTSGWYKTYKRIQYNGEVNDWDVDEWRWVHKENSGGNTYYYFYDDDEGVVELNTALAEWFKNAVEEEDEEDEGGDSVISASEALDKLVHISGEVDGEGVEWDGIGDNTITEPEGMKAYVDFIDMNPHRTDTEEGTDAAAIALKASNVASFEAFLASEDAEAGRDYPEAAGACLDESMRSAWWEENSEESRKFFDISLDTKINDPDALRSVKVTNVPLIVFWTDAAFQSLSTTQSKIQPTQPTSYSAFEDQWNDDTIIPSQDKKILMHFGNKNLTGWSTVKNWKGYVYGGKEDASSESAIETIGDEILKMVPEVLRVSG